MAVNSNIAALCEKITPLLNEQLSLDMAQKTGIAVTETTVQKILTTHASNSIELCQESILRNIYQIRQDIRQARSQRSSLIKQATTIHNQVHASEKSLLEVATIEQLDKEIASIEKSYTHELQTCLNEIRQLKNLLTDFTADPTVEKRRSAWDASKRHDQFAIDDLTTQSTYSITNIKLQEDVGREAKEVTRLIQDLMKKYVTPTTINFREKRIADFETAMSDLERTWDNNTANKLIKSFFAFLDDIQATINFEWIEPDEPRKTAFQQRLATLEERSKGIYSRILEQVDAAHQALSNEPTSEVAPMEEDLPSSIIWPSVPDNDPSNTTISGSERLQQQNHESETVTRLQLQAEVASRAATIFSLVRPALPLVAAYAIPDVIRMGSLAAKYPEVVGKLSSLAGSIGHAGLVTQGTLGCGLLLWRAPKWDWKQRTAAALVGIPLITFMGVPLFWCCVAATVAGELEEPVRKASSWAWKKSSPHLSRAAKFARASMVPPLARAREKAKTYRLLPNRKIDSGAARLVVKNASDQPHQAEKVV
jgi:hypothetical protein